MTSFRPHGLIRSPMQQQFYNRAHIANIYTGIADPREHETVALMEVVLYKNIFTEDYFAVTSEQPASTMSKRHCDIVIKYLESGSENIRTLCFAECKRTNKSQAFSLKALEEQAADYCKLYLEDQKVSFVYAATMAGAHVRLWKCTYGDKSLMPFWGQSHEGDWQQYKDIGKDADGRLIEETFNEMKVWPPTPHYSQTSSSYTSYQPASASSSSALGQDMYSNPAQTPAGYAVPYTTQAGPSTEYAATYTSYSTTPYESSDPPEALSYSQDQYGDLGSASTYYPAQNPYSSQPPASDPGGTGYTRPQQSTEASKEGEYTVVKVTRVSHLTRPDDFIFDQGGRTRTTKKSDWTKEKYNGKTIWAYRGRKTTYVTYDRIPS